MIADVGTGSGAIALSLAQEAGVRVLAIDDSAEALAVAGANAAALGVDDRVVSASRRISWPGLPDAGARSGRQQPAVRTLGRHPLSRSRYPAVRTDGRPRRGAATVSTCTAVWCLQAARALRPGGTVLLEVGYDQAAAVSELARAAGFALVSVHKDLSRKDRMVEATLPGAPLWAADDLGAGGGAGAARRPRRRRRHRSADRHRVRHCSTMGSGGRNPPAFRGEAKIARNSPVAVLFSSVAAIESALPDLDPAAARVLAALLPGPYTFVVATSVPRPELVGTSDSLGVRIPDHPDLLRLLAAVEVPLAATSANLSGQPDAATVEQVDPLVLAHCSVAVVPTAGPENGGARPGEGAEAGPEHGGARAAGLQRAPGIASTVVDLRPLATGGEPVVLREGAVSGDEVLSRIRACGS